MRTYNLDDFLINFNDWIDNFKLKRNSSYFSVKQNQRKSSLYGLCDIIYNLVIPNQIENYIKTNHDLERDKWIDNIQIYA